MISPDHASLDFARRVAHSPLNYFSSDVIVQKYLEQIVAIFN